MKFPDHGAVNAQTGFLLRKVSAAAFQAFSAMVGEHDLHPMHFGMMLILEAEEPISQHELGVRAGIDPSTMVMRMDALIDRGLVERVRSAEDRRSYEIRLSVEGRKLLRELRAKAQEHGDRFFAPLSDNERKQLHRLLTKLAASLDS